MHVAFPSHPRGDGSSHKSGGGFFAGFVPDFLGFDLGGNGGSDAAFKENRAFSIAP